MKGVRVWWDAEHGWSVEVPFALSASQAQAVVGWVQKVQGERLKSMRGDKREQAERALKALTVKTLHQVVQASPTREFNLLGR